MPEPTPNAAAADTPAHGSPPPRPPGPEAMAAGQTAKNLFTCVACGVVVGDPTRHAAWHDREAATYDSLVAHLEAPL